MSAQNTNLQLPALTIQDVNVTLPPDLLQAYKDFKRDLVLDIVQTYIDDDGKLTQSVESIVAANQAVLTSKLMQFASGTLYTADPDDPATKGRYEVIHEKKIEMTEYLVRNNGREPVLIAYHFKSDKEQLLTRLRKAAIDAQAFDGSRDMVRRWNAQQIPVMLLHPAAAGHGLNLQHGGSTLIWYTLPFSLEHYLQTNGRLLPHGPDEAGDNPSAHRQGHAGRADALGARQQAAGPGRPHPGRVRGLQRRAGTPRCPGRRDPRGSQRPLGLRAGLTRTHPTTARL